MIRRRRTLAAVAPLAAVAAVACAAVVCVAAVVTRAADTPTALSAPTAPSRVSDTWSERVFEGTVDLEAHFRRPGETRRYQSRQRYRKGAGSFRLDWTTWQEGDSTIGPPESDLVVGDRVFHRDAPNARWSELAGSRAELVRMRAMAGFPASMSIDAEKRYWTVERAGLSMSILARRAHPRLGDVENVVRFDVATKDAPATLAVHQFERDQSWSLRSSQVYDGRLTSDDTTFAAPAPGTFEPAPPSPDSLTTTPKLRPVAERVWAIDLDDLDSRTLVLEFASYLVVIEAAIGSANGERIVDAIRARWPSTPIRYAFASHYHPHYMGGMRAFMAEGASIVTTKGNAAFVRTMADAKFTIAPDRLARNPQPARILPFERRMELSDVDNHLVAIDIGSRSDHTDEFIIFWMPKQKLVFETEQGWVTVDGRLRATRRAQGFLKTLDEEGVVATRLVQSWPMLGNRAELTRAELDSLVAVRNRSAGTGAGAGAR